MLMYCPKCIKSTKYSRNKKCNDCNSYLKHQCSKCSKVMGDSRSCRNHLYGCKTEPKYRCNICNFKSPFRSNFLRHQKVKHSPRDFIANKCNKCGRNFPHSFSLLTHNKLCGRPKDYKHFSCDHCGFKTHVKANLSNHIIAKHLPRNINQCCKCQKNFSSSRNLQIHFKTCGKTKDIINSLKKFSCDHCSFRTNGKTPLSDHMHAKHFPRNYDMHRCKKCGFSFTFKTNLLNHTKLCGRPKNYKPFACNHCTYTTHNKRCLSIHIERQHTLQNLVTNKCEKCEKNFFTSATLKKHSQFCGRSDIEKRHLLRYSCDLCEYKAQYKPGLETHIKTKHFPKDNDPKTCSKCQNTFHSERFLKLHLKLCGQSGEFKHSIKRFTCDICKYKCHVKTNLIKHITGQHLPRNENFYCNKCGKNYFSKLSFKTHSQLCGIDPESLLRLKRFSCDHCKFKTHVKSVLVSHIQAKHLPRNSDLHKCNKCERKFSFRSNLHRHLKTCCKDAESIRQIKRFSCDICDYRALCKSRLAQHILGMHLPRNPHANKCTKCNKTFFSRENLRGHLEICGIPLKERKMRFYCDHCDYKTLTKSSLLFHINAKHLQRDPKKNRCRICKKNYSCAATLRNHSKVCGKTKDEIDLVMLFCDNCNFKTAHKSNLIVHIQAQHLPQAPKRNKCKKCGKNYKYPSSLIRHSKNCSK